jgi:hypothetical protein
MIVYKFFGEFADGRAQYEKWLLQRPEFRDNLAEAMKVRKRNRKR